MKDFYKMTIKEKVAALENLADKIYLREIMAGKSYAWLRLPSWIFNKMGATIQKLLLDVEAFFMPLYKKIYKHLYKFLQQNCKSEVAREIKDHQWWLEQNEKHREKAFEDDVNEKWFILKRLEKIRDKSKNN